MDVKVKRNDIEFITSIYRKPTFTGLLSKFYAFSPKENKENLVYTLTVRAFRICSDYFSFHEELQKLKSVLQSNGYPLNFIEKGFGKMIAKLYKPCDYEEIIKFDVPKANIYFSTIYLGDISKNIAKDLKELFASNYPQIRLNLV